MERITIVLQEGLGLNFEAMRPAMQSGAAVAIGRGGAVIAEVADGNAIEDKRKAAQSAGGLIDSVERYVENSEKLEGVVVGLESALICIESCAINWQSEPLAALRRIREITTAFLENSGGRAQQSAQASGAAAEPDKPGSAHARRKFVPCEQPRPARASACCGICSQPDHVDENCPWQGARAGLALVQKIDSHLVEHAQEFNAAPSEALKPSIFDIITGTAGQAAPVPQVLPSTEEHAAQIEQVAAGLREDQAELAKSILVLGDWLERVEIEDGYVGVPVIEAVEVVVTELKRQQKTAAPVVCRYGHWFAGDSDEATLIRERGICSDCAAVDDSWLGAQEPEGGGA